MILRGNHLHRTRDHFQYLIGKSQVYFKNPHKNPESTGPHQNPHENNGFAPKTSHLFVRFGPSNKNPGSITAQGCPDTHLQHRTYEELPIHFSFPENNVRARANCQPITLPKRMAIGYGANLNPIPYIHPVENDNPNLELLGQFDGSRQKAPGWLGSRIATSICKNYPL